MEILAAAWVFLAGYRIVRRNYTTRTGELDIIAGRHDQLIFIEVRYRARDSFGSGLDSVDVHKRRRIIHTALKFIDRHPAYIRHRCRFDVISISRPNCFPRLQWTRNAFTHDDASTAPASTARRRTFGMRVFE